MGECLNQRARNISRKRWGFALRTRHTLPLRVLNSPSNELLKKGFEAGFTHHFELKRLHRARMDDVHLSEREGQSEFV